VKKNALMKGIRLGHLAKLQFEWSGPKPASFDRFFTEWNFPCVFSAYQSNPRFERRGLEGTQVTSAFTALFRSIFVSIVVADML
jgi:hypothetical protein